MVTSSSMTGRLHLGISSAYQVGMRQEGRSSSMKSNREEFERQPRPKGRGYQHRQSRFKERLVIESRVRFMRNPLHHYRGSTAE
ncbi:hypothetical protein HPP92_017155 [Vanilla planifolia]|uniref:Uncharacterized protein n=1 Tax=Vanilla planifolia TaxID=51239 RepID=A0A835UN60_VANPL|nr:hypothetical protein HPP92_017155 [Vanilla planifolia]